MFKISQFYDDIIKVEDVFPLRLADNRLVGLSLLRPDFSEQRLAWDRALHVALNPRRAEEALSADSAECERLPVESRGTLSRHGRLVSFSQFLLGDRLKTAKRDQRKTANGVGPEQP